MGLYKHTIKYYYYALLNNPKKRTKSRTNNNDQREVVIGSDSRSGSLYQFTLISLHFIFHLGECQTPEPTLQNYFDFWSPTRFRSIGLPISVNALVPNSWAALLSHKIPSSVCLDVLRSRQRDMAVYPLSKLETFRTPSVEWASTT